MLRARKLPSRILIMQQLAARKTFAAIILGLTAASASAASVHDGYHAPMFTVPFAKASPKIDGVIDNAEWKDALSVAALQTTEGLLSTRQATVFMSWDADNIYLALRSPLRPGEKVMQAVRQTDRDNVKAVFDDSYEIWLNADTRSPDGEIVFFQYLGNSAGAKYDVMFEPTVGNSRPGWTSHWKPANRITPDGKFWECEVAIPRQSIYRNEPFADGQTLRGLIVRNFKRPWEQNNLGGAGSFSASDSHCRFVLSKTAPAMHFSDVGDLKKDTVGATIAAGGASQPLHWSFASDSGINTQGDFIANDGPAGPGPAADKIGDGYYRIHVTAADGGTPLLDWSSRRTFGDRSATTQPIHDTDDRAELNLVFNPVFNFVRVDGDLINYAARGTINRFAATVVDSAGQELATQELHLDDLAYVHGLLKLPNCPGGSYTARMVGYDASGHEVLRKETPFTKKDLKAEFPWWDNNVGRIDRVIAPWTPVQQSGPATDVWGRKMSTGAAGLPAQVSSQNTDLLTGPATL
ncbi:MAG: hypothetical protein JWM57_814, partial [Phycisphaerales bacterium]|nr:hypothetical protein [Phycisphaerales bacterium]